MCSTRLLIGKHSEGLYDPDLAVTELQNAGWQRYAATVWKSPQGKLFRGPALAFALMREFGNGI